MLLLGQHVPIAKAVGATDTQVEALERGESAADCFDSKEQLVLAFTTELVQGVRPSDETFEKLKATFTPQEIVELVLAIGFYMTVARLMETADVDLEAPAGMKVIDAARRGEIR